MKQFSTESGLKGWWLHKFAGFLYSVYLIAQVVDKYIVCAVKDESDIGAPGIALKGRADPNNSICRSGAKRIPCSSGKLILPRGLRDILRRSHAPKTKVICAGVDFTFAARANDVA